MKHLFVGWIEVFMEDFDKYQAFVQTLMNRDEPLLNAALGLAGETGEFVELVKKARYHGKAFHTADAVKELGDVLFYLAMACEAMDVNLSEVVEENQKKLRVRYPSGFVKGGGSR
jgi:NTP pyrophosphatase (non-canonical NTP hydrolase)